MHVIVLSCTHYMETYMFFCKCVHESTITCMFPCITPVSAHFWPPLEKGPSVHLGMSHTLHTQVSVMDAYCPHLGGNLGAGGRVIGNCIECPFHGWQFDGETGKCTVIPYAAKVSVGPSDYSVLEHCHNAVSDYNVHVHGQCHWLY